MRRVGITGGIGSGKSVVSHLLRVMGYPVYDTDTEAKRLMNASPELKRQIAEAFGSDIYAQGTLDRALLASRVFGNPERIARLNSIVHPAVRLDFDRWASALNTPLCFVESAILYDSGFDRLVDDVWVVTAPEALRIKRVGDRSGLAPDEVRRRMAAQLSDSEIQQRASHIIRNDGNTSLIGKVLSLLRRQE